MSEPITMSPEREAKYRRMKDADQWTDQYLHVRELLAELDATRNEWEIVTRDRDSWKLQSQTHNIDLIAEREAHKRTQEALQSHTARAAEQQLDLIREHNATREQLSQSQELSKALQLRCTKAEQLISQLKPHVRNMGKLLGADAPDLETRQEVSKVLLRACKNVEPWVQSFIDTSLTPPRGPIEDLRAAIALAERPDASASAEVKEKV